MEAWHILVTLGIIAFIAEIFTAGFISGSIGIGLLFAALGSYLSFDTEWQILLFAFGIILTYFLMRPIIMKYAYRNNKVKTNQDALIGRNGIVTEEINNKPNTGRVRIDGDDWKAKTINDDTIQVGATIEVVEVDSVVLIVNLKN